MSLLCQSSLEIFRYIRFYNEQNIRESTHYLSDKIELNLPSKLPFVGNYYPLLTPDEGLSLETSNGILSPRK